jgi:toxin ParE1/3/4
MKYSYRILEIAANELLEAAIWYNDKRKGLGEEIILSFEVAIDNILRNPLTNQTKHKKLRSVNINRFPYQIIYLVEGNLITVTAFFHASRNPKIWKTRKIK